MIAGVAAALLLVAILDLSLTAYLTRGMAEAEAVTRLSQQLLQVQDSLERWQDRLLSVATTFVKDDDFARLFELNRQQRAAAERGDSGRIDTLHAQQADALGRLQDKLRSNRVTSIALYVDRRLAYYATADVSGMITRQDGHEVVTGVSVPSFLPRDIPQADRVSVTYDFPDPTSMVTRAIVPVASTHDAVAFSVAIDRAFLKDAYDQNGIFTALSSPQQRGSLRLVDMPAPADPVDLEDGQFHLRSVQMGGVPYFQATRVWRARNAPPLVLSAALAKGDLDAHIRPRLLLVVGASQLLLAIAVASGALVLARRVYRQREHERERLRLVESELAHGNRLSIMGELAASLSHELKQPIAAALMHSTASARSLARNPAGVDEARESALTTVKAAKDAMDIIDRMWSLYKKGAPPKYEPVDINSVIREMMELLRAEADRYGVTLRANLAENLPSAMADRVQLQQVLMNLLLNAIEAMKNGGGDLTVTSDVRDGQLHIAVSDTGIGLPDASPDEIFTPWFTTKSEGGGMGLAISRSIVESHGGRLWAVRNAERGATLHFTLPESATHLTTAV